MAKSSKHKTRKPRRLTFKRICRALGLNPRQRVKLWKKYQELLKGGDKYSSED